MCWCKYWRQAFRFQGYIVLNVKMNEEIAVVHAGTRQTLRPSVPRL